MSMNWDDYLPFDPGVTWTPDELPRRVAKGVYEKLMREVPRRIAALTALAAANGIVLDSSDAALQALNDWFVANVEPDPDNPDRLRSMWYAVCLDIGLYLGELVIADHPQLHWAFYEWGKRNVSYQQPVVMGFTRVADPKYNVGYDQVVGVIGHRVIAGLPIEPNEFVAMRHSSGSKA